LSIGWIGALCTETNISKAGTASFFTFMPDMLINSIMNPTYSTSCAMPASFPTDCSITLDIGRIDDVPYK
ncbi:7912_t:CDS:2, partial [Entrophospora sp. SA101]